MKLSDLVRQIEDAGLHAEVSARDSSDTGILDIYAVGKSYSGTYYACCFTMAANRLCHYTREKGRGAHRSRHGRTYWQSCPDLAPKLNAVPVQAKLPHTRNQAEPLEDLPCLVRQSATALQRIHPRLR